MSDKINIIQADINDAAQLHEIEVMSFPPQKAASLEAFEYRLRKEGGIMSVDGAMVFSEHDGFYEDVMTESKTFHSTYSASLNANYANRRAFFESYQDDHEKKPILEAKRYLVMRTRTRVDTEGKVIRANYSQIYGPIRIKSNELFIPAIFFNPTPNDLNLEFDFKRNLSSKR